MFFALPSSKRKTGIVPTFLICWLLCFVVTSECAKELDIVIVLDGSNSIYPWSSIIDFLRRFIENIEIGPNLSQVCHTQKRKKRNGI